MSAVVQRASTRDDRVHVRAAWRERQRRAVIVTVALVILGVAAFCVELSVGDFPIPLPDVLPAIFGVGDGGMVYIMTEHRLPRALAAVLIGSAFGLSGAVFQSLGRNPLASPDIIGITSGAALAAVFIIVMIPATSLLVSLGALGGAVLTATLIYLLAYRQGLAPMRMLLVGIGVGFFFDAATSLLLTRARIFDAQQAMVWLTGSLSGRGWNEVVPLVIVMLVLVPALLVMGRTLATIQLGEQTALGLGVRLELSQARLYLVAVCLAGAATATAGPIAFVAFVAGPIARRLVGAPLTLVPAALTGALLLLVSDLVARSLFAPIQLPVGVVTAIIGAPYLIYLLTRAYRGRGV